MKKKRPDDQARKYLIVMAITFVLTFICATGAAVTVGPALVFNSIKEESAALTGLISASGLVTAFAFREAGNRRLLASAIAFLLIALVTLALIVITPKQLIQNMEAPFLLQWMAALTVFFFLTVASMVASLLMAARAYIFEGDGPVIPYPTAKTVDVPTAPAPSDLARDLRLSRSHPRRSRVGR